MSTRLIIEGNDVYEIDEECEACMKNGGKNTQSKGKTFRKRSMQQQYTKEDRKKAP